MNFEISVLHSIKVPLLNSFLHLFLDVLFSAGKSFTIKALLGNPRMAFLVK